MRAMKTSDAIKHFGSQAATAQALSINPAAVAQWGKFPPALRQLQLEAVTDGKLRAGPECDKFRVPAKQAA
jgi:DNA-binding transcriptional regulator YdaS (Cro superfamily)